jgi:hypothetical protein
VRAVPRELEGALACVPRHPKPATQAASKWKLMICLSHLRITGSDACMKASDE